MNKIIFLIALFLSVGIWGCEDKEKTEEKIIYPNVRIIKELPLIQIEKNVCKEKETIIINSQKQLNTVFNNNKIPECLTTINFEKHTVVLGSLGVLGQYLTVGKIKHSFTKEQNNNYTYDTTVKLTLDTKIESDTNTSLFGIIVEKIPTNSSIHLTIKEILPEKINKYLSELKCRPNSILRGKSNNIIGKWKLVQRAKRDGFDVPVDTTDVSCSEVIFDFKKDNALKVTEGSALFKEGVYKYTYYIPAKPSINSTPGPNLEVNDRTWRLFCTVTPYRMHILQHHNNSMVAEYFIRIK